MDKQHSDLRIFFHSISHSFTFSLDKYAFYVTYTFLSEFITTGESGGIMFCLQVLIQVV